MKLEEYEIVQWNDPNSFREEVEFLLNKGVFSQKFRDTIQHISSDKATAKEIHEYLSAAEGELWEILNEKDLVLREARIRFDNKIKSFYESIHHITEEYNEIELKDSKSSFSSWEFSLEFVSRKYLYANHWQGIRSFAIRNDKLLLHSKFDKALASQRAQFSKFNQGDE